MVLELIDSDAPSRYQPSWASEPTEKEKRQYAREQARRHGVDPDVFERKINQESGFRTKGDDGLPLRSPVGARGIAQFMPDTAAEEGIDPDDWRQALEGSARHTAKLQKRFGGDARAAVAAYNAGQGNIGTLVSKYGADWEAHLDEQLGKDAEQTRTYLRNILDGAGTPAKATMALPDAEPPAKKAGMDIGAYIGGRFDALPSMQEKLDAAREERKGKTAALYTGFANRNSALTRAYMGEDEPSGPAPPTSVASTPARARLDVGDVPYAAGQDVVGESDASIRKRTAERLMKVQGLDGDNLLTRAKDTSDAAIKRVAGPATEVLASAIDAGAIPGSPIFNAGRGLLGLEDKVPTAGELAAPVIVPQNTVDALLSVGPGNALKGAKLGLKGIRGLGMADNALGIIPKNARQLEGAMEQTLRIADEAKAAVLARGGTALEARQAAAAAIREAEQASSAVDDVTLATDRAVSSDRFTTTGRRLRGTVAEMSERMGAGVVPGERPKTSWGITRKDGSQFVVETLAGAPSRNVEEATARLEGAMDEWDTLRRARRTDQATGRANQARDGLRTMRGAEDLAGMERNRIRGLSTDAVRRMFREANDIETPTPHSRESVRVMGEELYRRTKGAEGLAPQSARAGGGSGLAAVPGGGRLQDDALERARQAGRAGQGVVYTDDAVKALDDTGLDNALEHVREQIPFLEVHAEGARRAGNQTMQDAVSTKAQQYADELVTLEAEFARRNPTVTNLGKSLEGAPASQGGGLLGDIAGVAKRAGDPASVAREKLTGDREGSAAPHQKAPPAPPAARSPAGQVLHELTSLPGGLIGGMRTGFASGDLPVMRQGGVLAWSQRKNTLNAMKKAVLAYDPLGDGTQAAAFLAAREADPLYDDAVKVGGIHFRQSGASAAPGTRAPDYDWMNDSFITKLQQKLPWIKGSERATVEFLNDLALETYKAETAAMRTAGVTDPKRFAAVGDVINHALGHSGSNAAEAFSKVNAFFSAQYMASRFNVLADPFVHWNNPEARSLAIKNLVGLLGGNAAMAGLMAVTGEATGRWSVNLDPTSGDFLQTRVGNTRYDLAAGFGPMLKTAARMVNTAATAEDFQEAQVQLIRDAFKYFENKEAPLVKMLLDARIYGKPLDPKEMAMMYAPGLATGVAEAFLGNEGIESFVNAGLAGGLGAVSVGANTYNTAEDQADRISQETYDGRKFDDLTPLERVSVVAKLPEEAQRKGKERQNNDFESAQKTAGWEPPPKDKDGKPIEETNSEKSKREAANADRLKRNPDLDVLRWAQSDKGGSLNTREAVTQALSAGLTDRRVTFAGNDRNLNATDADRAFWAKYGGTVNQVEREITSDPKNLDAFAQDKYQKPFGQLKATEQESVKTAILAAAKKNPKVEAVLIFAGQEKPNANGEYSASSQAVVDELKKLWAEFPGAQSLPRTETSTGKKTTLTIPRR